jgi:hypothetical protein
MNAKKSSITPQTAIPPAADQARREVAAGTREDPGTLIGPGSLAGMMRGCRGLAGTPHHPALIQHPRRPRGSPQRERPPRPPRWALVALSQIWERPRCNLVVASAEPSNCSKRQKKSKPAAVLNSNEVRAVGLRTVDHHTVVLASHARGRSASIVDLYSRDFERAAAINDAIGVHSREPGADQLDYPARC